MKNRMSSITQQGIIIKFLCFLLVILIDGNEFSDTSKEGLPFCGLAKSSTRYIFVSTLDGKLTALNPNNDGSVVWTLHPGSETMLSSSIHKLELSNYGQMVRMIPSLSGGLYKFNGESIEVIPVTADNLLQSSFKYSDDLVISGGKETQTFGVSLRSGQVIYECSMKGCGNVSHSTDNGEILVIQRLGQTVRAVEPRTGLEKWNFSVAQHDLKLLSDCHSENIPGADYKLHVVVPEGIIYATNIEDSSDIKWKHKFDSPVVNAWQLHRGKLIEVDLFSNSQTTFLDSVKPSIYIGMHQKQLYIQESVIMLKKRQKIASEVKQKLIGSEKTYPKIPWKPLLVSSLSLGITDTKQKNEDHVLDDASQRQTTALSVLYASSYVDGRGFYLYTEDELEETIKGFCNTSIAIKETENHEDSESGFNLLTNVESDFVDDFSEANTPVEIVIVSFWYYWKEVLIISISTAFLCNIMIIKTYLRWKLNGLNKTLENNKSFKLVKENDSGVDLSSDDFNKILEACSINDYTSRYLTDFDPVACLGKGGFGVVFEAKNKIDDCHYAIKRILLPNRQESKDRVLREVKALAKLDHHHIVRYFNAWTECPPPGWQENHDRPWFDRDSEIFTSNEVVSTETVTSVSESIKNSQLLSNSSSSCPSSVSYSYSEFSKNLREELNHPNNEVSDSFIVFNEDSKNSKSESKEVKSVNDLMNSGTCDSVTGETQGAGLSAASNRSTPVNEKTSRETQNLNKVYLYIQMQLCQRQSLKDWLSNIKIRDYDYVLNIFEQILQAVEHVHLHGLIHRDLKPSNIFFSLDNQIKVGDFGLVTAMTEGDAQMSVTESMSVHVQDDKHTAQVGTQLYMSQEQLLGKPYSYKVDIYSLGLILFELLVPFSTQMERIHVLQSIKNDKFPDSFKEKFKKEYELLRLMLSHCPEKRPTTYGVRARLPLKQEPVEEDWHFELPICRRSSSKTSHNSTSSNEGYVDLR